MATTTDAITGYLDMLGWSYKTFGDGKVRTTYRCRVSAYYYVIAIEVSVGRHWVVLRALLQGDIGRTQLDSVLRLISRWNEVTYRARFLLVGDCVVLQAEIPVPQLSADLFLESLSAICRYSTLAGVEIAAVATNPSLCGMFDSIITAIRQPAWDGAVPNEMPDLDFDISMNRIPDLSTYLGFS